MVASNEELPSSCPVSDANDGNSAALVSALCVTIKTMIISGGGSALVTEAPSSPQLTSWNEQTNKRGLEDALDAKSDQRFVRFQSSQAPDVTVGHYLQRIQKYSKCSDACLLLVIVYLDRLVVKKHLQLTELNVHRLLITGILLAAKFHDDLYYNNAFYAKLGGLSLEELNKLELELLGLLDFSLCVKAPLFKRYSAAIDRVIFINSAPSSPAPPLSSSTFSSSSFSPISSPSPCHLNHVLHNHGSTAFTTNTTTSTAVIPPSSTLSIATQPTVYTASAMAAPKAQHSSSHLELIMDNNSASSCLSLDSTRHEPQAVKISLNNAATNQQSSECRQRPGPGLHSLWSFENDSNWDLRGSDMSFSFDRPEDQQFTSSQSCSQLSMSAYSSHSSLSSASPGPLQRAGCTQPPGIGLMHQHQHVQPARTAAYQVHAHAPIRSSCADARQPAHSSYYQHHGLTGSTGNPNHPGGGTIYYQNRMQPDLIRREFQQQPDKYSPYPLSHSLSSDAADCRGICRGVSAERFSEPTASPNNIDHHHGSFHGYSPSLGFGFSKESGGPPQQFQGHPSQRPSGGSRAVQCPGSYRHSDSDESFEFSQVYGPQEESSFFLAVPPRPPAVSLEKQRQPLRRDMPELVPRDVYLQQQRSRGPPLGSGPPQAYWTGTNQYVQSSQSAPMTSQYRAFRHSSYPAFGQISRVAGGGAAPVWQRDSGPQQQPHHWAMNLSRQQQQSHYHSMLGMGLLAGPNY
eukprot:gene25097-33613_t